MAKRKADHAQYMRQRRATPAGREENRRGAARARLKRKQRLLAGRVCENCGFTDIRALQFHHPDPNQKTWTAGRYRRKELDEQAAQEIADCEVLCANCHAIEHCQWEVE